MVDDQDIAGFGFGVGNSGGSHYSLSPQLYFASFASAALTGLVNAVTQQIQQKTQDKFSQRVFPENNEPSSELELWSIYVAEFGFTWDARDLGQPAFSWIGKPDPESRWIEAPQPALRRACGQVIRAVRLITADDLCAGVEFGSGGWALTLLTELDDLMITDEPLRFEPHRVEV
jgi:hypothetical protein